MTLSKKDGFFIVPLLYTVVYIAKKFVLNLFENVMKLKEWRGHPDEERRGGFSSRRRSCGGVSRTVKWQNRIDCLHFVSHADEENCYKSYKLKEYPFWWGLLRRMKKRINLMLIFPPFSLLFSSFSFNWIHNYDLIFPFLLFLLLAFVAFLIGWLKW